MNVLLDDNNNHMDIGNIKENRETVELMIPLETSKIF